jgi:hypothetical protein
MVLMMDLITIYLIFSAHHDFDFNKMIRKNKIKKNKQKKDKTKNNLILKKILLKKDNKIKDNNSIEVYDEN